MQELPNKIQSVMRSLYRLVQIQESKMAPNILLENESKILKKRFSTLNEKEILFVCLNFTNFLKEARKETAIQDEALAVAFCKALNEAN